MHEADLKNGEDARKSNEIFAICGKNPGIETNNYAEKPGIVLTFPAGSGKVYPRCEGIPFGVLFPCGKQEYIG